MKYKFNPEILAIVEGIAALPDEPTPETIKIPGGLINDLERKLKDQREQRQWPQHEWAKTRRQLGFIYHYVTEASWVEFDRIKREDPELLNFPQHDTGRVININGKNVNDNGNQYRQIVKSIKDVHTGKALQDTKQVRLALDYGVAYLSDHEIQGLIDRNKV